MLLKPISLSFKIICHLLKENISLNAINIPKAPILLIYIDRDRHFASNLYYKTDHVATIEC